MFRLKRANRSGKKVRALTIEIWAIVVLAAVWGIFMALRQPWYISLAYVVVIVGLVDGIVQVGYRRFGPLPRIEPQSTTATVTGTRRTPDEKATLITLTIGDGDAKHESVLADIPTQEERERFSVGSEWSVHEFVDSRDRVILAEEHDDISRSGYDLCGVRRDKERVLFLDDRLGSELLRRAERRAMETNGEPEELDEVEPDEDAEVTQSDLEAEADVAEDEATEPVGTPQMRTAADGDTAAVDAEEPRA